MSLGGELLADVLSTPALPGAACIGSHEVFDAADKDPGAQAAALRICARCPVITACGSWAATQTWPANLVIAGRVTAEPPKRPRPTRLPQKPAPFAHRRKNLAVAQYPPSPTGGRAPHKQIG
ncbi:hypothetical protein ABW17_12075 [Mycobacterium nebraskense]|nr:hypothetical protein ABW17_12075 [Mycobacterium nebraskense]